MAHLGDLQASANLINFSVSSLPATHGMSRVEINSNSAYLAAYAKNYLSLKLDTELSGLTTKDSVIYPNKKIFLYYRLTGLLIDSTVSNENGAFSFKNIAYSELQNYFVVAITDEAFNAVVYDKLTG